MPGMNHRPTKRGGPLYWLKHRSRRFWMIAVAVVLLAAYPLSFGPAIWLTARGYFSEVAVQHFYMPFLLSIEQAESLENAVTWWGSLGVPDNKAVNFMFQTDEADHVFQFTRTGEEIPLVPVVPPSRTTVADRGPEMTIMLPALAATFAAFCVWLIVRIVNRRELWAKWMLAGVIFGLPALYLLSFGPACWWFTIPSGETGNFPGTNDPIPRVRVRQMYWPIGRMAATGPRWSRRLLAWYATLNGGVLVPTNNEDDPELFAP